MSKESLLNNQIKENWKEVRTRTYGVLNILKSEDLSKKLPFERSEDIFNQFYCMIGTTESFTKLIATGEWQGWASSLGYKDENYNTKHIKKLLKNTDKILSEVLDKLDLLENYPNKNESPLKHYLALLEHESHHLGQLINFIYALDLEIPKELNLKWGLSRD